MAVIVSTMGIMRRNRRIPDNTAHPVTPELFRTSVSKKMSNEFSEKGS